jgi:hypothetical protein
LSSVAPVDDVSLGDGPVPPEALLDALKIPAKMWGSSSWN